MAVFPGKPPNPLGVKVELNLAGSWTDITVYAKISAGLQITNMGRADESSSISASQLTLTLKNDGRFTPKLSTGAYYPNILRNTQVRVSVNATSATAVAYSGSRFYGEISSWPPGQDVSGRDNYVQVTASGIWRRISQTSASIGSAFSRYMAQLTGTSIPATYWSMEDGNGSTAFVTSIGAGGNATFTGAPSFSSDGTSFAGCDALPALNGARITAPVSSAATATNNVIRFALSVPAGGDSNSSGGNWNIIQATTAGTFATLEVYLLGNGTLQIDGVSSGGTVLFTAHTTTNVQGTPLLVSAELTPSGGSVNWALRIIKPGAGAILESVTGTRASSSIGAVSQVTVNRAGILSDTVFGQLGVFYAVPSLTTAAAAVGGFAGEAAVDRFTRLCAEAGIATTVIGSASAAMGPQADDTLAAILQSIEDTDGGLLFESRDQFGLEYRTLGSLQNQSSPVTLNYGGGVLGAPLAPVYDDQLVKNQWTVTNTDGYAAQATLTSGAVSIAAVPNGVGVYAGTASTNANTHAQVNAIAQQRLFQGTVDDVRYPTVTVNMARAQAAPLFSTVPSLRIGDYIQITGIPAVMGGSSTSKQLTWGYSETISHNNWTIVYNAIPELPFETAFSPGVFSVVQAPSGPVASGSQVGSSVSGSQLPDGSVPGSALAAAISARTVGGMTSFISAATPYDWVFAVSGTPADKTYFIATEAQAFPIAVGDTFSSTSGLGGPFTVTSVDPPSGGNVTVHFTPDASSVMSVGTVQGGKDGDTWVNLSGGNQVNIWAAGVWTPVTWTASSVIAASSITASLIAAGSIIAGKIAAGAIDGMTITGATLIADGASGENLIYSGTPATGNLVGSWSGAAGTDGHSNAYAAGLEVHSGGLVLDSQGSSPSAVSGASTIYTSSGGRLRYLSAGGADLVIDRSALNLTHFSMTTSASPVVMSGALDYLANEAQTGSEYEVEIDGTITTPTSTSQVYQFSLFVDGAILTGTSNRIGLGLVMMESNPSETFAFHLRWSLSVEVTGAGGAVTAAASGGVNQILINLGNLQPTTGGMTGSPTNLVTVGNAFDTTSNHTIQVTGNWATAPGSGSAITYRTKITRRY